MHQPHKIEKQELSESFDKKLSRYKDILYEIAINYLNINPENYSGLEKIIHKAAIDLRGLKINEEFFQNYRLVTILLGLEEYYIRKYQLSEFHEKDLHHEKLNRLGILLGTSTGSNALRMESFGSIINQFNTFTPDLIESSKSSENLRKALELEDVEASIRLKEALLDPQGDLLEICINNLGLNIEDIINIFNGNIRVVVTKVNENEFRKIFKFAGFAIYDPNDERYTVVIPQTVSSQISTSIKHIIRHEITHIAQAKALTRQSGLYIDIDRSLVEIMTEMLSNIPDVGHLTNCELKDAIIFYPLVYVQHIRVFVQIINTIPQNQFNLSSLAKDYMEDNSSTLDRLIVSRVGLTGRFLVAFMLNIPRSINYDKLFFPPQYVAKQLSRRANLGSYIGDKIYGYLNEPLKITYSIDGEDETTSFVSMNISGKRYILFADGTFDVFYINETARNLTSLELKMFKFYLEESISLGLYEPDLKIFYSKFIRRYFTNN